MFCKYCGNQLEDQAKICPKCNQSVTILMKSTAVPLAAEFRNPFPKIIIIGIALMVILPIVAIFGAGSHNTMGLLVSSIINIALSLMGLGSVLGVILGVIFGVHFLTRPSDTEAARSHYIKLALYSFITPTIFVVAIILDFVLVRVIINIKQ